VGGELWVVGGGWVSGGRSYTVAGWMRCVMNKVMNKNITHSP